MVLPWGAGLDGWWADPTAAASDRRYVLFDARGERLYGACYAVTERSVDELTAAHATTVSELLDASDHAGAPLVGDAAVRHRRRLEAAGRVVLGPPAGVPTADALLALLALRADEPPLADAARWEPEYLKASSAERERLGASAGGF
jgi:tRNA A37 threonylcarbamoyladenosine modification protein TsaB